MVNERYMEYSALAVRSASETTAVMMLDKTDARQEYPSSAVSYSKSDRRDHLSRRPVANWHGFSRVGPS
jgi:hypothetical protein